MKNSSVGKKTHKIPTPEYLANAALYYLERFAASEASLRRVLWNKVRRAAMANPAFAADEAAQESLKQAIEKIIETHKRTGIINDDAYARMKRGSLRRAGKSRRTIERKLIEKGVTRRRIEAAMAEEEEEQDAELIAATLFAKKRGFLKKEKTPDAVRKMTAAFARAGFSFALAKQVLNFPSELTPSGFDTDLESD
jgi:regulatory protein